MKSPKRKEPFLGELTLTNHLFPKGPAILNTGRGSDMAYTMDSPGDETHRTVLVMPG